MRAPESLANEEMCLCGCSVRNMLCCDSLTLIPNSKACGCAHSICGQFNEEIS